MKKKMHVLHTESVIFDMLKKVSLRGSDEQIKAFSQERTIHCNHRQRKH